jgi:hypothetical protein
MTANANVNTELQRPGSPHTRPNLPAEGIDWPGQMPSGPPVAPGGGGTAPAAPPSELPPGVHPNDPSGGSDQSPAYLSEQGAQQHPTGTEPFARGNGSAFGVFQRAASDWSVGVVIPNANQNGGTATVVGRQKGRVSVKLWVPTTLANGVAVTAGVVIGPDENELQAVVNPTVLNVGDSITIETEGSVYCGVIPGQQTGVVQYLVLSNPPGGGVGD